MLILSINDYLNDVAPTPDWLKEIHADSVRNGTDKLTMAEIDEEIAAARKARRARNHNSGK